MNKPKNKKGITKKPLPIIIGIILAVLIFGAIILLAKPHNNALKNLYNNSAEIKAEYKLEQGTLKAIPKDDPRDRIEVVIGNKPDPEKLGAEITNFEPTLTIARWDEVNLSIKPKAFESVALKDRTLKFDKEKTIFETPKVDYSLYELPIDKDNPEGGFEYQIDLLEKPTTNKIEFTLNTKGLDFFYQPPLTQEYKNGYNEQFKKEIVVSETQVKDLEGNVLVNRPENVVGSYAVYTSEQKTNWTGGKLYKTGKFGHIYRPKIIDSAGNEVWGILNIDKGAGILSVEIPQSFLDTAIYPIRHAAGSTFGYTSTGATTDTASAGYPIYFFVPEASPVGTLTGISYYADCVGTSVVVNGGFYSATAEKNYPYSRLTQKTGVTILDAPGLYDFDVDDYTLIDGARNYFAFVAPTGNAHNHYYDSVPGEAVVTTGQNFWESGTSLPATASTTPTLWSTAQKVSVYGTYTGSATTKPFMGNPIKYTNEYCGYALDVLYHKFQAPTTGLISSITVYVNNRDTSEHGIHVAIYDHDAINNYPENPLGSSTTHGHQAASTSGYVTVDLSAAVSVTAGVTYWLAFQFESADPSMCFYYGTEVGNRYCREASTWGVFPNPAVDSGWDEVGNFPMTIYATYAAALTELKHTVTPAGQGGDFNTLDAAIDHLVAVHPDLVTANVYATIEIDGDWTGVSDTAAVTISDITTDATHYLYIYTTAAARHAGVWSASKYNLVVTAGAAGVGCILLSAPTHSVDYVRIDGLQLKIIAASYNEDYGIRGTPSATSDIRISNCIFVGSASGTTDAIYGISMVDGTWYIWNNILYGFTSPNNGGYAIYNIGATSYVYSTVGIAQYKGIRNIEGTLTCKNCYFSAAGGAYYGTIDLTTCASSDTTGTAGLQNIAANTTQFVNVTAGSENFHLAGTGSALYNVGTDTTGDAAPLNFTTDIDGETRDATWDIGADAAVTSLLKHTVTPAGQGGDFNTLAAAVAHLVAVHPNLVTADVYATIEIDGDWTGVSDTAAVTIDGLTTNATHYLYIYTTATARHAGVWSTSKYNLLVANATALTIVDPYVRIDGLQIGKSSVNASDQRCIVVVNGIGPGDVRLSNLICKNSGSAERREQGIFIGDPEVTVYIWNVIVYGLDTSYATEDHSGINIGAGTVYIYSSTVIGGYDGIYRQEATGTVTAKNVYAGGSGNADFSGTITETNCASEDTTAGGTNHTHAALDTDTFVNITATTENYHLAADGLSPLQAAGVDTTGDAAPMNFTTDIGGQTRSGTWDIGADEYGAAKSWQIKNGTIKIKHGTVKIK